MIKFVKQKSRDNSIKTTKNFLKKKSESNDSGTESDGDILDADKEHHEQPHIDMEIGSDSPCVDANSPSETASTTAAATAAKGAAAAAAAMMCQSHLMYDQHSSEEELEVINGPEAATNNVLVMRTTASSSLISERGSIEPDDLYGEAASLKNRSSSTLLENRKRSLAHGSDDELRNFLEPILTPVNFRTSPPLEAFKPNRSHMYRSSTPLILSEARCGIENIKLCDNSVNDDDDDNGGGGGGDEKKPRNGVDNNTSNTTTTSTTSTTNKTATSSNANNHGVAETGASAIKISSLKMSNSSHLIYQPMPKYTFHYNSSRSSPASTSSGLVDAAEVRSVSPPAKLFHCAISPRRRPPRNATDGSSGASTSGDANASAAAASGSSTTSQRLQRPHRPCLDFDKMQQVSL